MKRRKLIAFAIVLVAIPFLCYPFCILVNEAIKPAKGMACLSNVKQLAMAQHMYAAENNDRLLNTQNWMDKVLYQTKSEYCFHCPGLDQSKTHQYGYAMNIKMLDLRLNSLKDPRNNVLLFDSVILDRNACSNLVGLPDPPRHGKNSIAFADGHAARTVLWPKNDK